MEIASEERIERSIGAERVELFESGRLPIGIGARHGPEDSIGHRRKGRPRTAISSLASSNRPIGLRARGASSPRTSWGSKPTSGATCMRTAFATFRASLGALRRGRRGDFYKNTQLAPFSACVVGPEAGFFPAWWKAHPKSGSRPPSESAKTGRRRELGAWLLPRGSWRIFPVVGLCEGPSRGVGGRQEPGNRDRSSSSMLRSSQALQNRRSPVRHPQIGISEPSPERPPFWGRWRLTTAPAGA